MIETGAVIALASVGAGIFGAVLVFMVKIEHRLTHMETLMQERWRIGARDAA